ncbi:hypothetical protein [Nonomuraea sp. NPDC049750]|uniref:hypothetical protein n=1 Tax=Nonomuraea sp. NPDC049750 TaxID=3154738 RepID=UPI0034053502
MGWGSAGDIFDPVARALIEAGASDDLKRNLLGQLIDKLRDGDWDTEGESLEEFRDDPLIIALFRERGITADCGDQGGPEHADECTRTLGHDGDHVDDQDYSWPKSTEGAS